MGGLLATIDYSTEGNFTPSNAALFNWPGTKVELSLQDLINQTYSQAFASDAGFTYDNTKAEFVGGLVRQIDFREGWIFGSNFNVDEDANFGPASLVGTLLNNAAIIGNQLDLTTGGALDYPVANFTGINIFSIKLRFTPSYSGSPAANQFIFEIGDGATSNNQIRAFHQPNGKLNFQIFSAAGVFIASLATAWAPVNGTQYRLRFEGNITAGANKIFINDIQLGATNVSTGVRTNVGLTTIRLGDTNVAPAFVSNFKIDDFLIADTVIDSVGAYVVADNAFFASKVELPQFSYPGAGAVQAFTGFTDTEVGSPRYVWNDLYWNGASWVASNGSYAQATPIATILTNIASHPSSDTLDVDLVFDDSVTLSSVDQLDVTYTGQEYSRTNPSVIVNASSGMTSLLAMTVTNLVAAGADEIKFTLFYDGIDHYVLAGLIVNSDGTYAQSSTLAEWQAILPIDIVPDTNVQLKAFLHSDDGSTTPSIEKVVLEHNLFVSQVATALTRIFGYVQDGNQGNVSGADITVKSTSPFFSDENLISVNESQISDSNGYYLFVLPETQTAVVKLLVKEKWVDSKGKNQSSTFEIIVSKTVASMSMEDAKDLADAA